MADKLICQIDGCSNPVLHRGWCSKHYQRWQKHGDPTISLIDREQTGKPCKAKGCKRQSGHKGYCELHFEHFKLYGDPLAYHPDYKKIPRWLEEHKNYNGNDCLIWPFSRSTDNGRGCATINGKTTSAPRVMCIMAHGEPPTDEHHTAHSCGNGHLGCVNPKHLRWATQKENEADKIKHGTIRRGRKVNTNKLTETQVKQIRESRESNRNLALRFGITTAHVWGIRKGKCWTWLK